MKNIYDYSLLGLEKLLLDLGETKFRARQIYEWIYKKDVDSFSTMTNVSKLSQEKLSKEFCFTLPEVILTEKANDGTVKFLLKLSDGELIETVLMPHDYGKSVCVSSQVGCNMGCLFCASGLIKAKRNLVPSELVGQILVAEKYLKTERVSHVVVMGIGEPFLNYENVIEFIKIINNDFGLGIGARHISVSTCGIVPMIKKFSKEPFQVNLAISLHFPFQKLREKYMPVAKTYPLEKLLEALHEYYKETNRRITIEYLLIDKVNDTEACALELVKILKGLDAYVNLIPINKNPYNLQRSSEEQINKFHKLLLSKKVTATIRKEFGQDIDAACGQLKGKFKC